MKKIKMLDSIPGTINGGLNVILYKKGLIYEIAEMTPEVVQTFLDNGFAEEYLIPEEVLRHEKGLTGAPTNKREGTPINKATVKPKRTSRKK